MFTLVLVPDFACIKISGLCKKLLLRRQLMKEDEDKTDRWKNLKRVSNVISVPWFIITQNIFWRSPSKWRWLHFVACICHLGLLSQHLSIAHCIFLGPEISFHCNLYSLIQDTVSFQGHCWEIEQELGRLKFASLCACSQQWVADHHLSSWLFHFAKPLTTVWLRMTQKNGRYGCHELTYCMVRASVFFC